MVARTDLGGDDDAALLPLIAYADAWSPSTAGLVSGRVVYVGDKTAAEIQAMAGQLQGAIVLTHLPQAQFVDGDRPQPGLDDGPVATGNPALPQARSTAPLNELMPLLAARGRRRGAEAERVPRRHGRRHRQSRHAARRRAVDCRGGRAVQHARAPGRRRTSGLAQGRAPDALSGGRPEQLQRHRRNPGRDPGLRDEVVLIGAHLDSWHTANGATDNADGAVAVMEAMRILAALGAEPRRTIRAALWSGEEQGLLGAAAYVAQHFDSQAARDRLAVYLNDDPEAAGRWASTWKGIARRRRSSIAWLEPLPRPRRHAEHHRGHRQHRPRAFQRRRAAGLQRDQGLRRV